MKAVLFTFAGTFMLLVLNLCKFNAEENILPVAEKENAKNETSKSPKNDTKVQQQDAPNDNGPEEEIGREENIVLPTVAPATPVPSSFILISTSDSLHSVLQTIKQKSDEKEEPSIIQEDDSQNSRIQKESQVDEVEFDTSGSDLASQQVSSQHETNQKTETPQVEPKDPMAEQSVDIMKYNVDPGKEDGDIETKDPVEVNREQETKESKERVVENITEAAKDVTRSTNSADQLKGSLETEASEKGILESFKDWKEKLETNEKKVIAENVVTKPITKKRTSKKTNYASYECGAKVIASNNEAENIGAILNENRDLYMLNPCSCSIWFVIELCEKVRAETIDVANFELFSSSPEKFNVYFSTRYPTREWEFGGNFNGKAEKTIQSFHMTEEFYAKFVKIEMVSHFGKEHYCPLSLVRLFGRSEVEELDDSEDTSHDHDGSTEDAESNGNKNGELPNGVKGGEKNFLKSATDMVIGLVNKATKSFTGVDEKKLSNSTVNGERNATEQDAENKTIEGENADATERPTVIQIVETDEKLTNDSNGIDYESNSTLTDNGNATASSSKLVILLEGDDTDEEAEIKYLSKNCVFYGEIQNQRCADPRKKFWIEFLFIHRMCPSFLKTKRKIEIRSVGSHNLSSSMAQKNQTEENLSFIQRTVETSSGIVLTGESMLGLKNTASSSADQEITTASPSSSLNKSTTSSLTSSVNAKNVSKEQENLSAATKVEAVPKTSQSKVTELTEQQVDKEMKESCSEPLHVNPDLSQILEAAESLKAKKQREDSMKKEFENISTQKRSDGTESDSNKLAPESTESVQKATSEHVDVLFISYDEKLKEGKAEASEKENRGAAENQTNDPDAKDLGNLEKDSSNDNKTEQVRSSEDPVEDHQAMNGHKEQSLNDPEKNGAFVDAENAESSELSTAKEAQESSTISTFVAEKTVSVHENAIEDLDSMGLGSDLDMAAFIAPSFSQPVSVSQSSEKTSSDLGVGLFSSNITGIDKLNLPVSPAAVLERSLESDMLTVPATQSLSDIPQSKEEFTPQSMPIDLKESFTVATERLDVPKQENTEKVAPGDASMKIGSGSFGNNKESAILKLKSRVKGLETNLSLSMQYLEEMSKRYGTALEEQQKQFKVKINALNLTLIKNKEIMEKQEKNLDQLTKQVLLLSMQLRNLTEVSKEQNLKMAERYAFTCTVEVVIIIIILWTCIRRPRAAEHQLEQRRHSAPSAYSHHNDHDTKSLVLAASENRIDDQRPSRHGYLPSLEAPVATKRRRPRKKSKGADEPVFDTLAQLEASSAREAAMISKTAGVLFSAGKGIFNGLTGAFTKQPKTQIASRRTRALVDVTGYENINGFGRSQSLETVDEDEENLPPQRHRSLDSIRGKKYSRIAARLSDKKRG
eukprot:gene10419-19121_t